MNVENILKDLIQIPTANPPGNERLAVDYIAGFCQNNGLAHEIIEVNAQRANIIVRLAPQCAQRLIILGHLDVVPADPDAWEYPPFEAEIHDGYMYGRGALDMKYFVAVALSVLAELSSRQSELEQGITCVFTADEENGSAAGLPFLLENPIIRRELSGRTVLNEGGGFAVPFDGELYYLVETGQKTVARLHLEVPELPQTNPYFPVLDHERILVDAVRALERVTFPSDMPQTARVLLHTLLPSDEDVAVDARLERLKAEGHGFLYDLMYAMTHNMITATVIHGGSRNDKLRSGVKASADFDCRLLPGIGEAEFLQTVQSAVADLPVNLSLSSFSQGFETSFDDPIWEEAEVALKHGNANIAACLPFLTPGANDGKYLQPLGSKVLGFAPLDSEQGFADIMPLIHGNNERISLKSLEFCRTVIADLCKAYVYRS